MSTDTARPTNVADLAAWRGGRTMLDPFGLPAGCCVCGRMVCEGNCPVDLAGLGRECRPTDERPFSARCSNDYAEVQHPRFCQCGEFDR